MSTKPFILSGSINISTSIGWGFRLWNQVSRSRFFSHPMLGGSYINAYCLSYCCFWLRISLNGPYLSRLLTDFDGTKCVVTWKTSQLRISHRDSKFHHDSVHVHGTGASSRGGRTRTLRDNVLQPRLKQLVTTQTRFAPKQEVVFRSNFQEQCTRWQGTFQPNLK